MCAGGSCGGGGRGIASRTVVWGTVRRPRSVGSVGSRIRSPSAGLYVVAPEACRRDSVTSSPWKKGQSLRRHFWRRKKLHTACGIDALRLVTCRKGQLNTTQWPA